MSDLQEVNIRWKDSGEEETVVFGIGEFNPVYDDYVFFWIDTVEDLDSKELSPDFEIV